MSDPPLLELRDVAKAFGTQEAVRGVTEAFQAGEYVCILGASGCGKTTLLRLIAGFETPSRGDIALQGRSLVAVPPERRNVNLVFQDYALFPHLTVRANVEFGLEMRRVAAADRARRADAALALVDLPASGDRSPQQLSGGQRQRVAVARALVNEPAVLLLDEPLSALDRGLRQQMQAELRRIQRNVGITFLHVTHDQGEALSLADRVAVMHAGRFVQVGTPREIYERPRSRLVAEFVGASNVIPRARLTPWLGPSGPGDGVTLVRPERIEIAAEPMEGRAVVGTVRRTAYFGATVECLVDAAGLALVVHVPAAAAAGLTDGATVWLRIAAEAVVVLAEDEA